MASIVQWARQKLDKRLHTSKPTSSKPTETTPETRDTGSVTGHGTPEAIQTSAPAPAATEDKIAAVDIADVQEPAGSS